MHSTKRGQSGRNMPVPLTSGHVDKYMGSVLQAAIEGDLSIIENL